MATALKKVEVKEVVAAEPMSETAAIMSMIQRMSTDQSISIERVEQAFAFYEKVQASQARKAFDAAMAAAKSEIPVIIKNRVVDFTSAKGRTHYKHEDLGEIARTVDPILAKHGLSYRFRTTSNLNEPIRVTCIVSHADGFFEENTLSAGRDESGNKNAHQSIGSSITYLQRYTLKAALGLAAAHDDDAVASGKADDAPITEEQISELIALADDVGADKAKFCKFYKIDSFADIFQSKFAAAKAVLESKRNHKAKP